MLTTSDREVAEKARLIRAHGSKVRYLHEMLGYKLRMTDIAAAIELLQLGKLQKKCFPSPYTRDFLKRT